MSNPMLPLAMIPVALYARYSTDNQTDNSIAYQLAAGKKYCDENNFKIVATFTDEAETGTNDQREGFQGLIRAAKQKLFSAVVVYDISRGSRDVADWFNFRKEMKRIGVDVIAINSKLGDILNPQDFLVELLSVGMGQVEVLTSRQKSIAGKATKAKQGIFMGGVAPLGYRIEDGKYVIVEDEARAVRLIYEMYADWKSYKDIIEAVSGIPGRNGRPIGKNSLYSILRNERYIGVYTWNKKINRVMHKWAGGKPNPDAVRIEGIIPPIINKTLWEKVQKRVKDSKHKARNKAKRTYLLSGLIECASCGATYVGHTSTNTKGYETRYYTCGNKYRTRSCKSRNINADQIESFVMTHLKAYLRDADFSAIAHMIAEGINGASPDLSSEKRELAEINRKISNGVKAILSGTDIPELQQELDALRARKIDLEEIINTVKVMDHAVIDENEIVQMFREDSDTIDQNPARAIRNHVTKIYASADGSYTVNIGVHISGSPGWV